MKKGHKFLIGFSAAAITFGIWMMSLGQPYFNRHGKRMHELRAQPHPNCYNE